MRYKSRNIVLSYASKYFRLDQTLHSSKDALLFCYEEPGLVCLRSSVNSEKDDCTFLWTHMPQHLCFLCSLKLEFALVAKLQKYER